MGWNVDNMEGILWWRAMLKKQGPLEVPLIHKSDAGARMIYQKPPSKDGMLIKRKTTSSLIYLVSQLTNTCYILLSTLFNTCWGDTLITQLKGHVYHMSFYSTRYRKSFCYVNLPA
jgi:hypothetical protein